MSAPSSGRARNYEEAAKQSEANAAETSGAFQTGLQIEADKTRELKRSNQTFVAAQEAVRAPNGHVRIPDLIVQTQPDSSFHMLDIKAGRNMGESAPQLRDLTQVKSHRGMDFSSLRVVTATHSYNTDLTTLQQVHDFSDRSNGLPVMVRSSSMGLDQYLPVPDFRERADSRNPALRSRAAVSTVSSPATHVPPVPAMAASSGPRDTSSLAPPTPQFQSSIPSATPRSGATHTFQPFQSATTSGATLSPAPQGQSHRTSTGSGSLAPVAPRQSAPTSHQLLPAVESNKRKAPAAPSHPAPVAPVAPSDDARKRARSTPLEMPKRSSPAPVGPKLHGSKRAIMMVQAAQKMAQDNKKT